MDACRRFLEALDRTRRERQLAPIISKLEKQLAVAFREQGTLFLKGFAELRSRFPPPEQLEEANYPGWWFDYAEWWPYLQEALAVTAALFITPIDEAVLSAFIIGGHTVIADMAIPLSFNLAHPRATAYLRDYGARLISGINNTTKQTIHDILVRGSEQGWGYDKTARAINTRFEEFAIGKPQEHIRSRGHLVAITETGNAYEEAGWQAGMQMQERGILMEKFWNNVGDDRVSDGCLANTAVGWIPIDQPFPSGHQHPLRFPGCRCSLLKRRAKGT